MKLQISVEEQRELDEYILEPQSGVTVSNAIEEYDRTNPDADETIRTGEHNKIRAKIQKIMDQYDAGLVTPLAKISVMDLFKIWKAEIRRETTAFEELRRREMIRRDVRHQIAVADSHEQISRQRSTDALGGLSSTCFGGATRYRSG